MIVTSIRCYLNILTQFMTREQLLDAQYYVADKTSRKLPFSNSMKWNMETGQYEEVEENDVESASPYLVEYAPEACNMNMSIFMTDANIDIDKISKSKDPRARFQAAISQPEFLMSVYQKIIRNIRKDKLFIMIFLDEPTVRYGAGLVCEMLSRDFGQDVTFIDPQYRPYVQGRVSYVGNKQNGEIVMDRLRKSSLCTGFIDAMNHTVDTGKLDNIHTFLDSTCEEITDSIYLYNSLWPDDPLPPGRYTNGELKEMLIQRALDERPVSAQNMSNMSVQDDNAAYMYFKR